MRAMLSTMERLHEVLNMDKWFIKCMSFFLDSQSEIT